jgi:hypothetical protein
MYSNCRIVYIPQINPCRAPRLLLCHFGIANSLCIDICFQNYLNANKFANAFHLELFESLTKVGTSEDIGSELFVQPAEILNGITLINVH